MKKLITLIMISSIFLCSQAQKLAYPFPVNYLSINIEDQVAKMAYMDVKPQKANGQSVLLFHGKNFNGYYWKDVIAFLVAQGYRVIVPDQLGFGKSGKPNIHYSFSQMAANTMQLLNSLNIDKINIIAHSMGGMLATRFVLMYPENVDKLIYENPIGLEDYRTFVPYKSIDDQFSVESKADFNSLKTYQQSYYPVWKPEYDQYVTAQLDALGVPDKKTATWASALTYNMIYQQPVLYEFKFIRNKSLLVIGQADRTIVGKNLVPKDKVNQYGQYPALGKMMHQQIKNSTLVELAGVGHIPHIQAPAQFRDQVLKFLK